MKHIQQDSQLHQLNAISRISQRLNHTEEHITHEYDSSLEEANNTYQPLTSLVATAKRILPKVKESSGAGAFSRSKSTNSTWQNEAWDMYDLVGELHFIMNIIAGQVSKARLKVGYMNDEGVVKEVEADSDVAQLLHTLGEGVSGQETLLHRWGLNLQIPGEGYLVGIPGIDRETGRRLSGSNVTIEEMEWHLLSISEISRKDNEVSIQIDEGEGGTITAPISEVYLIRVHRPHPRRSWEADSPVRSALPILKELVGLTMHVSAQVDSRLSGAGILTVPKSVQESLRSNAMASMPGPAQPERDPFLEELVESMMTAISDRASAAAVVPIVMTVPDEFAGKIQHISFTTPLDSQAQQLREEAIRRLALSMDIPPEVLLGTGDMNHWSSWLVQDDTVKNHINPILSIICDALTQQFLWEMLRANDPNLSDEEIERYSIYSETDHLVARPNQGADAQSLYDRGLITRESVRRASGFEEADAGDDEAMLVTMRLIESNPGLMQTPGLEVIYEQITALLNGSPIPTAGEISGEDTTPEQVNQHDQVVTDEPVGGIHDVTLPDTIDEAGDVNEPTR